MNTMYLPLVVLAAICLMTMVISIRRPLAIMLSMAAGAAEILLMLYAGCDAVMIETLALGLCVAALWLSRRSSG